MGDHILPQVLLRGFSINKDANKTNQKIMIYDRESIKVAKIKDRYQVNHFYSRETEILLEKEFEAPFARLKRKMEDELVSTEKDSFMITKKELLMLIRFVVVMWRRNDIQIDKIKQTIERVINDPYLKEKMIPRFRNKTTDELINSYDENFQQNYYSKIIHETTVNDPTVLKTYKYYTPVIIVNKTDINFPLHNKYASVQRIYSSDEAFPDFTIEPISNRIYVLFVLNKQKNNRSEMENIKVVNLSLESEVILLIQMYVINSVKSVVLDDSNKAYVKAKIDHPELFQFHINNDTLQMFLKKIGM